jgi:hypothetical protein
MAQKDTHNWHFQLICRFCKAQNEINADNVQLEDGMCLAYCPSCKAENVLLDGEGPTRALYEDIGSREKYYDIP